MVAAPLVRGLAPLPRGGLLVLFELLSDGVDHGNVQALVVAVFPRVLVADVDGEGWHVWVRVGRDVAVLLLYLGRQNLVAVGILIPLPHSRRVMALVVALLPRMLQADVDVKVRQAHGFEGLSLPLEIVAVWW